MSPSQWRSRDGKGQGPFARFWPTGLQVRCSACISFALNNRSTLLGEVSLASKLQKVTRGDPTALPAEEALEMATITGARALGMEKEIGSLEVGKRADMITLSLDEPHATPVYDVVSTVAYSLESSDVRDVMVNGKVLVQEREVQTIKRAEVLGKAREYRLRISESLREKGK